MIIYLYGPDSYRRQEKLKAILDKYKAKHSALTIERFDLFAEASAEADLGKLKDFVRSQSLFDSFKFGIIYAGGEPASDLAELLKNNLETKDTVLAVIADSALPRAFEFLLKKPALSEKFEPLEEAAVLSFLKKEAAKLKLNLSREAMISLLNLHKSDLWGIKNDLEKISLGGKPEESPEFSNFFVLLNRFRRGNPAALEMLLESDEPAKIFNIIAAQADPYLKIKMADYDAAIKSGKMEYEEALTDLVIS